MEESTMEQNVGGLDRTVRLVVGLLLLLVGIAGYAGLVWLAVGPVPQALASVIVALIGVILLATGLTRICLIHRLLGIDTTRR